FPPLEPPWLACFQADNRNRRSRALNAEKALSNGEGKRWKARSGRKRKKRRSKTARLLPAVLSEGPSSAKFKGGYTGKKQAAAFSEMSFFRGTGGVVAAPADFGPYRGRVKDKRR